MTTIQLLACIGMITGFFLLLGLKPMEFTNGLFSFLTREKKSIRDEIKQFLQETLHLRLNMNKTKITHAHNEKAFFLGYFIQRGNKASRNKGNIRIKANINGMIEKLYRNGLCNSDGFPIGITQFILFRS